MSDQKLTEWLLEACAVGASDLHIVAGFPPTIRLHGSLCQIASESLASAEVSTLLRSICPPDSFAKFQQTKNLDYAPSIDPATRRFCDDAENRPRGEHLQRFRANYFIAGDQMGACFRIIPRTIPDLQWAGFPDDLADRITGLRNGMVLFTGVTGSGKSTSMAMMIKRLIDRGVRRIITIEDPIEYVFDSQEGCLVTQRSVGRDVDSFSDGLKYGLRQDPDVMLVGEIRDRETAQIALSAAETGHVLFATMHARDAKGAISRFTDLFPQSSQFEVRSQLAFSLRVVVSQHLIPNSLEGEKRELALEVLLNNLPIASAIRTGKIESIDNNIQTGKAEGMCLLDDSIGRLLAAGRITRETALKYVSDPRNLQ